MVEPMKRPPSASRTPSWVGSAPAAGAIWAAVLYGFLHKEKWAWFWGAVAATIQLLAGFFPAIPAMDSHLPTPTLMVFGLAGILWFGMLFIGGVDKKIITLTFIAGLAYVLTFIDGVAPIAKYTTSHRRSILERDVRDVATGQLVGCGGLGDVHLWHVLRKKSWAFHVGIFAGTMSMLAGYPLGLHNALFEVHRFSMFLPAPFLALGLVIYLGSRPHGGCWKPGMPQSSRKLASNVQNQIKSNGTKFDMITEIGLTLCNNSR